MTQLKEEKSSTYAGVESDCSVSTENGLGSMRMFVTGAQCASNKLHRLTERDSRLAH